MNVLLVEDDIDMRQLLCSLLEMRGHTVTAVVDGEAGWEAYQNRKYPLVILDWILPGMSGLELCRMIRSSLQGAHSLILMVTACTHSGDLQQVLAAGADDYLAKPFDPDMFNIRLAIAEHGVIRIREKRLAEAELRTAAVALEAHKGIIITDDKANIIRVNRAFSEITGYSSVEMLGENPRIMQSGLHPRSYFVEMWQELLHNDVWVGEIWDKRKNGEIYPSWLTITAVRDELQEITNYVAIFSDITARKKTEQEIHHLAFYDALTELPNRRLFQDRFYAALNASERHKDFGAVLFIDMDKFKSLNDTLGHDYGDLLLIEVGVRIKSCIREMDTVARYGGDEFVVLIEGVSKNQDDAANKVARVAEKIRESLARPYQLKEHQHRSSPSIGICLYHGNDASMAAVIEQADMAMYEVKKSGRNAICFFDPLMQSNVTDHHDLVRNLQQSIELNQLQLHYQIQVDSGKHPLGAEAFLRWDHPVHGLMLPGKFIPLAEESTLILAIDQWVLKTACRQLAAWSRCNKTRHLTLTVNISAKQFGQPDFVSLVAKIVREHGVSPDLLKLELSERVLLENMNRSMDKIRALKELGIRLSMDNSGTVFSSLSYLSQISSDQLKINQDFVQGVTEAGNDAQLVRTIVGLARSLDMDIFAEGVETEAQRAFLQTQDCRTYQGYLFGRPVAIEQFDVMLGEL